jgi:hypothetical protein
MICTNHDVPRHGNPNCSLHYFLLIDNVAAAADIIIIII